MADDTQEIRDFLIRAVSDMVAIPSPSGHEKAMADYVFSRLSEAGVKSERDSDDNVMAEIGSGKARLHVNGHMDTVVPVDGWRSDPFKAKLEGDLLFGLGSADCKAGLAAMLWLLPRVKPKVRVLFSFTVCEEGYDLGKSNGSEKIAAMGGDWVVICEPTCKGPKPCLGIGTQGHARAWVTFTGKAAHSSRPEDGKNAVHAAARFCAELEKMNSAFPENEVSPGVRSRATVAATLISGGKLSNVIPDRCDVTVSRRLAPGETVKTFEAELNRLLLGEGASYRIANDGGGAATDRDGVLLKTAAESAKRAGVETGESFFRGRTDAVIYARHGLDTLMIGPGDETQCHAANEHLDLRGAVATVRLLEELINSLEDRQPSAS